MELNLREEKTVLLEYHKNREIESLNEKIHKLRLVPPAACAVLAIYALIVFLIDDFTWVAFGVLLTAILVGIVGYANVVRTDLLTRLFELKYGKY